MKITDVETLILTCMHEPSEHWFSHAFRVIEADCAIVVIETDAASPASMKPAPMAARSRFAIGWRFCTAA
jgi:hypothetical protein